MANIQTRRDKDGNVISYRFRACVGRDDAYKQIWRTCTIPRPEGLTPKKEANEVKRLADAWEQEQIAEYKRSHFKSDKSKITFKDFTVEHWMKDHVKTPDHTPSSIEFFEYTSQMAIDYFGDKKLREIDVESVKRYINHLKTMPTKTTGKPFGATSVKHFFGTLKNILSYAKRMHYIDANPCDDLSQKERPGRQKKDIDFLEPAEAIRFLQCLEKEPLFWKCLLNVLLKVGLRRGEACGLQWQDLDENKLELHICRNVTLNKADNSEETFYIGLPKSKEERTVPVSQQLYDMLMSLKAEREYNLSEKDENGNVTTQVIIVPTGYIFSNVEDPYKPIRPDSVTTKVRRFVEKNHLQNVSPHDLRHSAASLALEAGADLKEVQELLGHADPETTMRYYTGISEARKRKTVDNIEALLSASVKN